jgi:hypothetical protein
VFHIQLRQFPNQARAFNLGREELDARILGPWTAGAAVEWDDRKWSPEKARLTVYEGPELKPEEIGMGRGWGNATRTGADVTERLLAEAARPSPRDEALAALKDAIAAEPALALNQIVPLVTELPRPSERLAIAEQAVWELLHRGMVSLVEAGDAEVPRDRWQAVLLAWDTWTEPGFEVVRQSQ